MRRLCGTVIVTLWAVLGLAPMVAAQDQTPPVRLFLDCWECDSEYLRQHLRFVEYVRDRGAADVHVLVTSQSTGSGGTSWTIRLIGLGALVGQDRASVFTTPQNATSDDRRREFTRMLRLALAGYAAATAVARDLDVTFTPPTATAAAVPVRDPWNSWVFRLSGNGSFSGELSSRSSSYRTSVSGSRVTEQSKISFSTSLTDNNRWFLLSDGRKITSDSNSSNAGATYVYSVGPRVSVGTRASVSTSSFSNTDRSVSVYPGVEFNVFPYSEFQRRSLTIWYELGPSFYKYRALTVYDKLEERITKHQMDVSYRIRQEWGSMSAFASVSQHLANLDRYSASVHSSADVRLFKGFSFNVWGSYARIKNQVSLAKGGATPEEILLRLRQLQTDYSYSFSTGFSYTFGSIFNSVVNPRFGGF
jgi:type II secretory pathway pseudopilin PulG